MGLFSQDTKVQALKRVPLFQGLSRSELLELARKSEDVEVEAGTVLCKQGDSGDQFFVIVDGDVDVKANGRKVATRSGGDFVGEISLLEETQRTATVTAKTPLRLFVLTRADFRQLVADNPKVESKVLRTLAQRVVELSNDPTVA